MSCWASFRFSLIAIIAYQRHGLQTNASQKPEIFKDSCDAEHLAPMLSRLRTIAPALCALLPIEHFEEFRSHQKTFIISGGLRQF